MSIYRDEISSLDPTINPDKPVDLVQAWNPVVDFTLEPENTCVIDIYPEPKIYVPHYFIRQYCVYRSLMDGLTNKEEKELFNELTNKYNGNKNS